MKRVLATAVFVAALVACPVAAAHGGGRALGFRSKVTTISPATPGLKATVLDYDDRVQLTNNTGKTVIVLGYENEPYLMFRNGRVYRNEHSPATYLNDDRYGQVKLPPQADAKAAAQWKQIVDTSVYDWHDHRIHWMSRTLPPKVERNKNVAQHVFNWTVPISVEGKRTTIKGTLDYQPRSSRGFPFLLVLPAVLLICAAFTIWAVRRARAEDNDARSAA